MVKKLLLLLVAVFVVLFLFTQNNSSPVLNKVNPKSSTTPSLTIKNTKEKSYVFVPYWSFDKNIADSSNYSALIYFGITGTKSGIDRDDSGFKKLIDFTNITTSQSKYLSVRMLNSENNSVILRNLESQKNIINDTVEIANDNKFNGILLDLEISALPFDSLIKQINNFVINFNRSSKSKNLKFYVTVYGDNFYRYRSFDVKTISQNSDGIFIMAYDFHKAGGEPGPNFPFEGNQLYGYDFKTMVNDFTKTIGKDKITIVFGLFGYDWEVDDKNHSMKQANAFSYSEIKNKFLNNCANCKIQRNKSLETEISYRDESGKQHIVWYEDMDSINLKKDYLKSNKINSIGYWAYSYF